MVDEIVATSADTSDWEETVLLCEELIDYCQSALRQLAYEEDRVTLQLWSEGFKYGRLKGIFAASKDLKLTILRNLTALSNDLRHETQKLTASGDRTQVISSIQDSEKPRVNQLSQLLPGGDSEALDDDLSTDDSSLSDEDGDREPRWRFRLQLLMNLVPSMERLYTAASNEFQQRAADSHLVQEDSRSEHLDRQPEVPKERSNLSNPDFGELNQQPETTGSQQSQAGFNLDNESDFNAEDLRRQFEALLTARRTAETSMSTIPDDSKSASTSMKAPAQSQNENKLDASPLPPYRIMEDETTPLVPVMPHDTQSMRFRNLLLALSVTPTKWENPGLLDEALTHVPINRIYTNAEEEHNTMRGIAASFGARPEWGYQDCVVRSLLRWFKREFFEFVANPKCSECGSATIFEGTVAPLDLESANEATRVELYRCSQCMHEERFPRYASVWKLLETRRGRVGESSNCFGMLCRAAGAQVRWVWCSEDATWTEVYSDHQQRWVHVDACEEIWDVPRVYTEGWGRKLGYCIAFSIHGATDVTRRYVRDATTYGLPRGRTSEECLLWIMLDICAVRRKNLDKAEKDRLRQADNREERELARYISETRTKSQDTNLSNQSQQGVSHGEVINRATKTSGSLDVADTSMVKRPISDIDNSESEHGFASLAANRAWR